MELPWGSSEFIASQTQLFTSIKRAKVFAENLSFAPASSVVCPARAHNTWALYFAYSPSGRSFDQHTFTIKKLKEEGFCVLLVLATKENKQFERLEWPHVDAVITKELKGFDFSGYLLGLSHLVKALGCVDVLLLNDSVFGPFHPIKPLIDSHDWDCTGFTSSHAVENHIQSYAFFLRNVDRSALRRWRTVFLPGYCLVSHGAVSFIQETRLARVIKSSGYSVGTMWSPHDKGVDLLMAFPLLALHGFPFVKRSVLGKFRENFDQGAVREYLLQMGLHTTVKGLFEGYA